jgi:hypothetical protein
MFTVSFYPQNGNLGSSYMGKGIKNRRTYRDITGASYQRLVYVITLLVEDNKGKVVPSSIQGGWHFQV